MKSWFLPLLGLTGIAIPACSPGTPPAPPRVERVVLVHGFLETGNTFKMLQKRLEKRGVDVYVPKLRHNDGRGGLENLAVGLKEDINKRFGPSDPISIVAFSMGGLVSRYYLQDLDGAGRCENLITISSPHNGTMAAWFYPSQGVKEMRPNSQFLTSLKSTQGRLGKMPVASYRTPLDLVILPADSSVWNRAENKTYTVLAHPFMLTSGPVIKDIEKRLLDAPVTSDTPVPVKAKNPVRM